MPVLNAPLALKTPFASTRKLSVNVICGYEI